MNKEEIFKKLRISGNKKMLIVNAPNEYLEIFSGIELDTESNGEGIYDFVQVFGYQQDELEKLVQLVGKSGKYDCSFWACYPKGTGKIKSNIKRKTVWTTFELVGLQAVSQIAINETWSALRGRPDEKFGK
jgi:hypothetical protein